MKKNEEELRWVECCLETSESKQEKVGGNGKEK